MSLSGTTQELDLKPAPVYYRAFNGGEVLNWVCKGLDENPAEYGNNIALGLYLEDKLIAGVIFNDIRPNRDVWLTIYSENKKWCNKRILRLIFDFIFDKIGAERASAFVSKDNEPSINLVEKLGFVREGLLRHYRDNGKDCFVYGMLKSECKWRSKNEQFKKSQI